MANLCQITISVPLDKVPDKTEQEQLTALYKAEKKWDETVKSNEDLRRGNNHEVFLASQPGVPFKRTEWKYNFWDEEVKNGLAKDGEIKPDSKQWNTPTIGASFQIIDGRVWVHPYSFGRGQGRLFDQSDGITVTAPESNANPFSPYMTYVPMQWEFKWSFPWWAQIGFAGGKKDCDLESQDAPSGQSDEFYEKWYEEHDQPFVYLVWESSVSQIVKNLEYSIKVYENFPVNGEAWKWGWVCKELNQLSEIYLWFKKIHRYIPEAIAYLDWSEVVWNGGMTYTQARANDEPNQIMNLIKVMDEDAKKLTSGELDLVSFQEKHTLHLKKDDQDYQGYVPILERDPFDEF